MIDTARGFGIFHASHVIFHCEANQLCALRSINRSVLVSGEKGTLVSGSVTHAKVG